MPRQNRVTPFGDIIATPERGTFLGNRGLLHDAEGRIRRPWRLKRWLVCLLEFKGRQRQVMTPGLYTELFFLDEATALAAGHRPCAECRRQRFNAFRRAWQAGQPAGSVSPLPSADEIDLRLHEERIGPDGAKRLFRARLEELPDGVLVRHPHRDQHACLVHGGGLLAWSPSGYVERIDCPPESEALVLTPESTVAAIRAGYVPEIHPSAATLGQ
jgi:hypothetical protein